MSAPVKVSKPLTTSRNFASPSKPLTVSQTPSLFWLRYLAYFLVFFTPLLMPTLVPAVPLHQADYFKYLFVQALTIIFSISFWIGTFHKPQLKTARRYSMWVLLGGTIVVGTLFSNHWVSSVFGNNTVTYLYSFIHLCPLIIFGYTFSIWLSQNTEKEFKLFLETLTTYIVSSNLLGGIYNLVEISQSYSTLFSTFRLRGTVGEPNKMGFYLVVTIPFSIALLSHKSVSKKVVGSLTLLLQCLTLITTFSRGSWLVLGICSLVGITLLYRQGKLRVSTWYRTIGGWISIGIVLLWLSSPLGYRALTHSQRLYTDIISQRGSITIRFEEWHHAWRLLQTNGVKEWLLGYGPHVSRYYLLAHRKPQPQISTDQRFRYTYLVRNHYLEWLLSYGLLGIISWLGWCIWLGYLVLQKKALASSEQLAVHVSFFAILIVGGIYFYSVTLWVLLMLFSAIIMRLPPEHKDTLTIPMIKQWAVVLATIPLVCGMMVIGYFTSDVMLTKNRAWFGETFLVWDSYPVHQHARILYDQYLVTGDSSLLVEAIALIKNMLALNSHDIENLELASRLYYVLGSEIDPHYFKIGKTINRQRLRQDPSRAHTWDDYGLSLLALGQPTLALDYFAQALGLDPDYRPAVLHTAESYKQLQQFDQAEVYYQLALKRWPDWQVARSEQTKLEQLRDQLETSR